MKCKACGEDHRPISDGEEVPRYVRAACLCERRDRCRAKDGCPHDVVAAVLEPDGVTVDQIVCAAHVPRGFDVDDFAQEKKPDDAPLLGDHSPTDVVCADCGHAHSDAERPIFFRVFQGALLGKMLQTSGCPKCCSVYMRA